MGPLSRVYGAIVGTAVERVIVTASDGRAIDVLVRAGDDTTTVMLHMGTPNGLVALPDQWLGDHRSRLVLYARPGYARSDPQPGRSVADAAADTATIMDVLGVESFAAVGWSGGGPHALACAALLPRRCLATAIIAGMAPRSAGVYDWTSGRIGMALLGDDEGLAAALEADRTELVTMQAVDVPQLFTSEADQAAMTGDLADWLIESFRTAFAAGVIGARDDYMAFVRDWGFDLATARNVTIWQGDEDDTVVPAEAHWLAQQIPDSLLRILAGEGHMSIGFRLPEILHDVNTRAR